MNNNSDFLVLYLYCHSRLVMGPQKTETRFLTVSITLIAASFPGCDVAKFNNTNNMA